VQQVKTCYWDGWWEFFQAVDVDEEPGHGDGSLGDLWRGWETLRGIDLWHDRDLKALLDD
jgi:hypothetical protein